MKNVFLKHEMTIVSYSVKRIEKSFTWYGHNRYAMKIKN